jgi:hypothetical protein
MSAHLFHGKSPDIIYYDGTVINNETFAVPASINDIRGQHIIETPEDWEMSVVRFDIDMTLVPPSTIQMLPGAVLGVLSPSLLSFTMRYNGVDFISFVQNNTLGEIFGFDKLLDEMNVCIAGLFAGLAPPPVETNPPILAYNPITQLITMYFDHAWNTTGSIELWSNALTREKLLALPITTFSGFNQTNGKDFRYSFTSGNVRNADSLVAAKRSNYPLSTNLIPDPMLYSSQEAITIANWNTTRSIKLLTTSLPIISQLEPQFSNITQQTAFSSASSQTISDFLLSNTDNPISDRISVEYLPLSEYRMISLMGKESIRRIQIQAVFTSLSGIQLPILLPPNGIFSCKLLFRRRD